MTPIIMCAALGGRGGGGGPGGAWARVACGWGVRDKYCAYWVVAPGPRRLRGLEAGRVSVVLGTGLLEEAGRRRGAVARRVRAGAGPRGRVRSVRGGAVPLRLGLQRKRRREAQCRRGGRVKRMIRGVVRKRRRGRRGHHAGGVRRGRGRGARDHGRMHIETSGRLIEDEGRECPRRIVFMGAAEGERPFGAFRVQRAGPRERAAGKGRWGQVTTVRIIG